MGRLEREVERLQAEADRKRAEMLARRERIDRAYRELLGDAGEIMDLVWIIRDLVERVEALEHPDPTP